MRVLKYVLVAVALIALLLVSKKTTGPKIGIQAPSFSARTMSGRMVDGKQLHGKTVVVEFWATWCPACVSSLPALHRFHEQYGKDPSIEVFAVHVPKGAIPAAVKRFCDKRQYGFPLVLDRNARLSTDFQIQSIPTLIVISPNGEVHHVKNGALGGSPEDGARRIKQWVDAASGPST